MNLCKHKFQAVVITGGKKEQYCLSCKELMAKWHPDGSQLLYEFKTVDTQSEAEGQ